MSRNRRLLLVLACCAVAGLVLLAYFLTLPSKPNSPTLTCTQGAPTPSGIVYDPSNGLVYVAETLTNHLVAMNATTHAVVARIAVGCWPGAVAFDPSNQEVFVANYGSGNVSVVNDSTHTVTSSISVGHSPDALLLTPSGNNLYVADFGSDPGCLFEGCTSSTSPASGNVTVVNATQGTVEGTIEVGSEPVSMAYDAALSSLYVTNWRAGTISVISTVTNTVIATISLSV